MLSLCWWWVEGDSSNIDNRDPNEQPANGELSQQSSRQEASPSLSKQPANQKLSQSSSKTAAFPNEQPANGEPSQQSSRQEASPSEQPANQEPSQRSSKPAASPNEQRVNEEPSQQSSEKQPLQIPKASKEWHLKPHTLDLTTGPKETVDDSNSSSSDGSDVIVCSE